MITNRSIRYTLHSISQRLSKLGLGDAQTIENELYERYAIAKVKKEVYKPRKSNQNK